MESIVSDYVSMRMKQMPRISVIMPAYNAERFLEKAVRSVMAQTVTDWELLVLDGLQRSGKLLLL